jgi:hypothetical protein
VCVLLAAHAGLEEARLPACHCAVMPLCCDAAVL